MAQRTLNDGTSGDVVIRSGPPASVGGSWGGGGFGGNRVGASGNFGGPGAKTIALRRKANQERKEKAAKEAADAAARALEQARVQTRQQLLAGQAQRHGIVRAEIDQGFAAKTAQLSSSLEHEISSARQPHDSGSSSERWQLYLISKEKNEIDGLIARKTSELNARNIVARSFDGHDPLTRTPADFLVRLDQFGDALDSGYQAWENAYTAAHESRLLSTQVTSLTEKSNRLASHHAEQTIVWREREAHWERLRQIAEQRDARIRFKQQADADTRIERVRQANTLTLPATSLAAGGVVLTPQGVLVAQEVAAVLENAVQAGIKGLIDLGRIALKTGPVFITGMLESPVLGNGELTPEQRDRLFYAVGVPAKTLELYDAQELQAIADERGSVETEYRLKPLPMPEGVAIVIASTGGEIDSRVPVVNAVLDPLTGLYTAEVPGSPTRHLQFTADAPSQAAMPGQTPLAVMEPLAQDIPSGVDLRIQDCIVCVPGLEPIYLSFGVPPMGTGVVTGTGQPPTKDWWNSATQAAGAAIPTQVGDQFRGREFKSFEAFDEALWRTIGEHHQLVSPFDEVNKKRIEQGFAPYAPKSTWVGENREFELRYQERPEFWSDPFNLDKISIKTPQAAEGWLGIVPAVVPWPIPPASSWKPVVPPGSEHIGSTTSPTTPIDPLVYPGNPAIPVLPQNETFPAVDEGEIGASIPGFPGDMELPSPDALFRDRRDDPGVATGVGQVVSGVWLGEAARGEGAPVPSRIADQLRWQEFRNFHGFRRAFWKAVAADVELRSQFTPIDLHLMKRGNAPYASANDRNGGRIKHEIHHLDEVAEGGAVYDMDNLVVMTPRRHIKIHGKGS
ncbi:S-type pyocin domain-containing protein [Pseudomonas synxantha]|uniref:Uncharacterized protein n=1 Tax=Pseudomonas synxantha TaxID=47883 RepID=A0ACC6JT83_9PSED|nr:S-type pyocin domain-containing protein [Pseudomonas synxantha]MDR6609357.1 hypothetical protein [Pseudomonas synxantha]